MFEFWFHGLDDGDGPFTHHGTTHDFLEVMSQVAQCFSHHIAGDFVAALLNDQATNLSFLRMIDWKFEYRIEPPEGVGTERSIILHKLK